MSSLKDEGARISSSLAAFEADIKRQIDDTHTEVESKTEEFKSAAALGDFSENSAFDEAKKGLAMLNATLGNLSLSLSAIQHKVDESRYVPIGIVTVYSTVSVTLTNSGVTFIYKLFPAGVADADRGILSVDSPFGKAIMGLKAGDTFQTVHRVTSEPLQFKINEVY